MAEDFAVLDFALLAVPPREVAIALAAGSRVKGAPQRTGMKEILSRILHRPEDSAATREPPLTVQPPGTLPPGLLARAVPDDMGFGGEAREMRLSAPAGMGRLTLLEFRERVDGGPSPVLKALSAALPGAEIFAFRLSGGRHPGADHHFAVYRGGEAVRIAGGRSGAGTGEDAEWGAEWTVTDRGAPHPIEAGPAAGGSLAGRMSPALQAGLLEALGVEPDALFEERGRYSTVLELSTRPGGMAPEALPAEGAPDGPSWEDEVTEILLEAVTDALPEADQVAWLDGLTALLETGEREAALARARALIARGARPEAERARAAARLAALFARRG